MKRLTIQGEHITDIASFYAEINRVLMPHEDWQIAQSLDALSDLFYGGYGEINQNEPVQLVWRNIEKSKAALGLEATQAFYRQKLANPATFNIQLIKERLTDLENGTGPTYIDIILSIIAEHPNIELV